MPEPGGDGQSTESDWNEADIIGGDGTGRRRARNLGSPIRGHAGGSRTVLQQSNVGMQERVSNARADMGGTSDASLLIIDDCALFREALATNLRANGISDIRVAWDLPSLISVLEGVQPSVVLLNMATRDLHLILRASTSLTPQAPVIAVATSEDDESAIIACAEAGVAGYHLRSDSFAELLLLVRDAASGKVSCPPKISAILLRRLSALASQSQVTPKEPGLTTREAQILGMLELGLSNQDIAGQLSIAVHTVKNHVHSLLTKLGVGTRAEAAALSHAMRVDLDAHERSRPRSTQNWP
ncbi:hypothetical protein HLY00_3743 [Mycolicibacterium hippocampi]|uniref:DNA-binding response regulator n=1 Tax=Mycolicibacterium hippocampi TaxID=659824 RepID=A0A850PS81_9MYCO|nr:hypothetical protein [Mycolicibacterium hippocampi]